MKEATLTIAIDRPAHEVFEFTLNPENTPKWVGGIVRELTSESPTKLGTIYKNQDRGGNWNEYEITGYEPGVMFVLSKKDDNLHIKYRVTSVSDNQCELEYSVWVDSGDLDKRFTEDKLQAILQKLKAVIEGPNGI